MDILIDKIPDVKILRRENSVIVSHFAYLYNRDKEGRKSRALELLTGQHSGNTGTTFARLLH